MFSGYSDGANFPDVMKFIPPNVLLHPKMIENPRKPMDVTYAKVNC